MDYLFKSHLGVKDMSCIDTFKAEDTCVNTIKLTQGKIDNLAVFCSDVQTKGKSRIY